MEKSKAFNPPTPVDDDEELPPSYEEAAPSATPPHVPLTIPLCSQAFWKRKKTKISVSRHERPLLLYLPNPEHVRCRCGAYVNTTHRSPNLPAGKVRCRCGYIVSSTGYACHPPQCVELTGDDWKQCSCGEALPDPPNTYSAHSCSCGAVFSPDGSVKRKCSIHNAYSNDARNTLCPCGRHVDTTALWKVMHGTRSMRDTTNPHAGYSSYDYNLPYGSGKCVCGLIVKRNGSWSANHMKCCEVISSKPRKADTDIPEGCTCAG